MLTSFRPGCHKPSSVLASPQASLHSKPACTSQRIAVPGLPLNRPVRSASRGLVVAAAGSTSDQRPPISRTEQQSPTEVADKLIGVFQERDEDAWRKLIAFSKQWPKLAPVVLERILERSKRHPEPAQQLELRKFRRRLERVHNEIQGFDALIAKFRDAPPEEWEGLVSTNQQQLRLEFFNHVNTKVQSLQDKPEEQEALSAMAVRIASIMELLDKVAADSEAMDLAAQQFDSLLQVGSLEEADRKIDEMASAGQLSPALMLTMAKAYAGAKDTNMTREEVKDIMAHLYFKAKESFAAEQPAEVRILKHLLTMADPVDVRSALNAAFQPSDAPSVLSAGPEDLLSTTPPKLEATAGAVLAAFDAQVGKGSMVGDAASLMTPEVIERLRRIHATIRKEFM